MFIRLEAPATPFEKLTSTPATFPANERNKSGSEFSKTSDVSTLLTAYPKSLEFLLIPKAVTTTSSSAVVSSSKVTSMAFEIPTKISLVEYPIKLITRVSP